MSIPSFGLGHNGPPKELYPPREAEYILSVSHAQLYRLIGAGRLVALKIGRGTYIPRASIEAFLAGLPAAKIRPASGSEAA